MSGSGRCLSVSGFYRHHSRPCYTDTTAETLIGTHRQYITNSTVNDERHWVQKYERKERSRHFSVFSHLGRSFGLCLGLP